ncbi:hypothetical protein D9756_002112 [Leucocoprinus leucothites]|uniref:Trimethylguanosine synthase n=1 Tax=Leucocoprinus leucothites TaxID=201217 RepID=A0A8H5GBY1_9AGAR|nr:hypothetical protein D9756_002112 [Leucoagaricus leucothites]
MGKRKSKTGMAGISRFVAVLNKDQAETQPTLTSLGNFTKSTAQRADYSNGDKELGKASVDGSNITSNLNQAKTRKSAWFRYDVTGLVPFYNDAAQVPEHLLKYFSQRMRYFSLYDKHPGCLLDEEGWYSITPERIADQIAERCRCDVVLDAFCGVGGNTIAFAKTCERVIALDTNPTRLALARHNAHIYGVADRIEFIQADYISFARAFLASGSSSTPNMRRKIDVVFLSPPWGGPSYLSGSTVLSENEDPDTTDPAVHPTYSLSSVQPIHGKDIFSLTRKITSNIAYYLPRNTNLSEISDLLNGTDEQGNTIQLPGEQIEVEEEWMGDKMKALTCYFGGLAAGQEHLF